MELSGRLSMCIYKNNNNNNSNRSSNNVYGLVGMLLQDISRFFCLTGTVLKMFPLRPNERETKKGFWV